MGTANCRYKDARQAIRISRMPCYVLHDPDRLPSDVPFDVSLFRSADAAADIDDIDRGRRSSVRALIKNH